MKIFVAKNIGFDFDKNPSILAAFVAMVVFIFYDPSFLIYFVGGSQLIAVLVIFMLFVSKYDPINSRFQISDVFSGSRMFFMLLVLWSFYFLVHPIIVGGTSFQFASSRVIRIIFLLLFMLSLYGLHQIYFYMKALIIVGVCLSIITILLSISLSIGRASPSAVVTVPTLNVEYLLFGWMGAMWPASYDYPFYFGNIRIYRMFYFFNEPAAMAFFLEPLFFYSLFFYKKFSKPIYLILSIVIFLGIAVSTSLNGVFSILFVLFVILVFSKINATRVFIFSLVLLFSFYVLYFSSIFDNMFFYQKMVTIEKEAERFDAGMGALSGISLLVGAGYDFVSESAYTSSNVFLSNLQRGGVIGLFFVVGYFLLTLKKSWSAIKANGDIYLMLAIFPNIVHMAIKIHYEFTFIYLINMALVYSATHYLSEENSKYRYG